MSHQNQYGGGTMCLLPKEAPFYPCTVRTLPIEGEEGGVAASLIIPVGEPWEGGDVEGTAKLTATPSSASPRRLQKQTSSEES